MPKGFSEHEKETIRVQMRDEGQKALRKAGSQKNERG